jgi:hypothetical protein
MARKSTSELTWMLLIGVTFFVLNCFSIHTGDDLGYMFTDTTHHCGDGERVSTFAQCITTQCHHYFTTNGRFAVHVVVMALLNLMPLWAYRLLNSLMFVLLWWLTCRLAAPQKGMRTDTLRAAAWLLLFVALPQPGLILLTLVSYSVNYLWVAVAVCALLLALQRRARAWWMMPAALFVGSLQESFSLPLCAAFVVASLLKRMPWRVTIAFIVGTAVEVFAPGNMSHAAQGGGLALDAVRAKTTALGSDLCRSIITPAAVALAMWFVCRRRSCTAFCRENIVPLTATVAALALATLTFTSPRQLTAPTLFAIIMLLQRVPDRRWLTVASAAAVAVTMAVMAPYKAMIYNRYQTMLETVDEGKSFAYPNGEAPVIGNAPFARAFIPDPLCNRGLVAIGDKYSKQGLSRLRGGERLNTILPLSPKRIAGANPTPDALLSTYSIGGFSVTATIDAAQKPAPPYECFRHDDTFYFVKP